MLAGIHQPQSGDIPLAAECMLEKQAADEGQARLLGRIAARDAEALSEFYDQTAAPFFSVVLRILGDAAEAEEVIQDVFVQIWEKAESFDSMLGSAFHWAMSIARHRAIDRLRARQRRARLNEELTESGEGKPSSAAAPDEGASGSDVSASVRNALNILPPEQRRIIEMAFFGGLTHPEIAERLGEPLGTVKARIRRGLLKLRDNLQAIA